MSNHKGAIAFYWIAVAVTLLGLTGMRLLESLTKRVKRKKKQTEISKSRFWPERGTGIRHR